ncbi:MAG: sirohydrochlorin chelatase [Elainellaceae cyanobacterium]
MSQSTRQPAYFVVYHGSRDPRPAALAQQLAEQMKDCLRHRLTNSFPSEGAAEANDPMLAIAPLECCDTPLQARLVEFAREAREQGYSHVQIIPLFLMAGVHVREDIPAEVEAARSELGDRPHLILCPYLGSHPHLADYLRSLFPSQPSSVPDVEHRVANRLLISHGSRRLGGNQKIEAIAQELEAQPAYWSVEPSVEISLISIIEDGAGSELQSSQTIEILPYFLFAGGITDAIAQTVEDFQHRFPQVQVHLAAPLGANRAIAQMAVKMALEITASSTAQDSSSSWPHSSDPSSFMASVG